jgi:U3 small nucleolar RNA-associated protein 4
MSWWDREVHIWRISKPTKPARESAESESESEDRSRSRKLVAKVLIKGEANIKSASISDDGRLLAVATSAEVKVFHLESKSPGNGDALRVSKIETPSAIAEKGARLVQFSPDSKWLLTILKDNKILASRLLPSASSIAFLPTLAKLARLDRKISKIAHLSGLGSYDRSITRVAFSADSRILAVGDLAGYIDTFVLEGVEDLDAVLPDTEDASSEDSDDDDDEEDEEEGRIPTKVFGQHWIRNPSAEVIPKLPSAPVVLSFRPSTSATSKTNGTAPHVTRNNPHPNSHNLPTGEDRLLILTSTSQILEFSALSGSLTPWSRANPTAHFPEEFKGLRDQAMGSIWDVSKQKERVWLYGSSWMWMFDLSRNLPVYTSNQQESAALTNGSVTANGTGETSNKTSSKKRKRRGGWKGIADDEDPKKGTSGAGSKVPDEELGNGIGRKMQKFAYEEHDQMQDLQRRRDSVDDEEDDDDEMDIDVVTSLISRPIQNDTTNGNDEGGKPHWYNTYKYRPIMGVVPLRQHEGEGGDGDLEVCLVERPIWEADLPPRFYGDQEWEKNGL